MKFSIGQAELAAAFGLAVQAVSTRSTLPVLGNVLMRADDLTGTLTLAATNLEVGITVEVAADVTAGGGLTLPARLTAAALAGIPAGAIVDVKADYGRMAATLAYTVEGRQRGAATVKGIDAEEFPLIPQDDGPAALTFESPAFARLVKQSAFAVADARDTSRPALTGVLMGSNGAGLTAAATDGYRLAVVTQAAADEFAPMIVPARALLLAEKLAAGCESVEVRAAKSALAFTFCGAKAWRSARLVSQVIDAKFPDYHAIIPKQTQTTAEIDTQEALRALKLAALFAQDNTDRVLLTVAPGEEGGMGKLTLQAQSQESGAFETDLDALVDGPALQIAFNAAYLMDALSALNAPTARLELVAENRPGVIKGANFMCVIMPMQLQK